MNQDHLLQAIEHGFIDMVIDIGSSIDYNGVCKYKGLTTTVLQYAAFCGRVDILQYLVGQCGSSTINVDDLFHHCLVGMLTSTDITVSQHASYIATLDYVHSLRRDHDSGEIQNFFVWKFCIDRHDPGMLMLLAKNATFDINVQDKNMSYTPKSYALLHCKSLAMGNTMRELDGQQQVMSDLEAEELSDEQ